MKTQIVEIEITDETVAADDAWALIEPVWNTGDIYGSVAKYEESLQGFSKQQRHLFAIQWYRAEVCNGGHDQFFFNSTGIVWRDALEGLKAIELDAMAAVLTEASKRMGGASQVREERQAYLKKHEPDFGDLDDAFYDIDNEGKLDEAMLKYARKTPTAFHWSGAVERVIFPEGAH